MVRDLQKLKEQFLSAPTARIDSFRGEHVFLSNFSPDGFRDEFGNWWNTNEHYFQAYKAEDDEWFGKIMVAKSPSEAKKLGKKCPIRKDWEYLRVAVMMHGLRLKFDQNEEIKSKLIDTMYAELVEGNTWGDDFWGVCRGRGKNMLGKLLMMLRVSYVSELLRKHKLIEEV